MKRGTFTTNDGRNIRQVNKTIAKKIYESGGTVYLLSSNLEFNNNITKPQVTQKDGQQYAGYEFGQIIDKYILLNCDSVRGRYVNYFVEL